MAQIQLGDHAKDAISGFEGVVDSMHFYLNGCVRYGISPTKLNKDGNTIETKIFDAAQVVGTGKSVRKKLPKPNTIASMPGTLGGDRDDPPRREMPER